MARLLVVLVTIFIWVSISVAAAQLPIEFGDQSYGITIQRVRSLEEASGREPERGMFLVFDIMLTNQTSEERCFYDEDFELDSGIIVITPVAMGEVRDEYYPDRDYPGWWNGQCLDGSSTELSLLVYDLPSNNKSFELYFKPVEQRVEFSLKSLGNDSYELEALTPITAPSEPSPEDKIRSLAASVVGRDNVRDIELTDVELELYYYVKGFDFSNSAGHSQIEREFPRLICALRAGGFDTYNFEIAGMATLIDAAGNEREDPVVTAFLYGRTVESMNCANVDNIDIVALADTYEVHPAARE